VKPGGIHDMGPGVTAPIKLKAFFTVVAFKKE